VLRAARKIIAADPDWRISRPYRKDYEAIFYNHGNLHSYGLMQIAECSRSRYYAMPYFYERAGAGWERLEAALADSAYQKEMTPPDGQWWCEYRLHCAERDGDAATVAALKAQREAEEAQQEAEIEDRFRAFVHTIPAHAGPSLAEIAGQLRELAAHNDPDEIREGLTEVADRLERLAGPPPLE
jgi:hypothetical protein